MRHLRIVCRSDRTDRILSHLCAEPGAVHVVVARGGAVDPAGDVVEADVAREAPDDRLLTKESV